MTTKKRGPKPTLPPNTKAYCLRLTEQERALVKELLRRLREKDNIPS